MTPPQVLRFKNLGTVLSAGLLALTPIGTGFIKPIVDVFGAKQFHPLLQSTLVETYYVNFYVAINIGALVGGIAVPIAAGYSMVAAYSIPFVSMFLGYVLFLSMSKRFVKRAPEKTALLNTLKIIGLRTAACKPFDASKKSSGGLFSDHFVDGVKRLLQIIPVSLLVHPFNIVYGQMNTYLSSKEKQ